jgi:hypothetical protein
MQREHLGATEVIDGGRRHGARKVGPAPAATFWLGPMELKLHGTNLQKGVFTTHVDVNVANPHGRGHRPRAHSGSIMQPFAGRTDGHQFLTTFSNRARLQPVLDSALLETEIGPTRRLARFDLISVNDERSGPCKLRSVEV